jgi:hypothetical protein
MQMLSDCMGRGEAEARSAAGVKERAGRRTKVARKAVDEGECGMRPPRCCWRMRNVAERAVFLQRRSQRGDETRW